MLPKIQALAVEGVRVECRKSTEKSWIKSNKYWDDDLYYESKHDMKQLNRLTYPGQFEMICYKLSENSSLLDSNGTFNWDNIHEEDIYSYDHIDNHYMYLQGDFMSMETSFNSETFELWILSDRCNPNHHCGDEYAFKEVL